jgi:hypothetical protein
MHILVELDGVLRDRSDQPIGTGILLVSTLIVYNQITFISSLNKSQTEQWLNVNKIINYDDIIDSSSSLVNEELAQRQINVARARGAVDVFITGNPNLWVYAFDQGIPAVMFGMPAYLRPEFRPDAPKKMRAWGEIEAAVERQNEARAKDARVLRTETLNFEG